MFKHILVLQDGEVSLLTAACAARAEGSSVVLLQVVTIPMNYGYGSNLNISL